MRTREQVKRGYLKGEHNTKEIENITAGILQGLPKDTGVRSRHLKRHLKDVGVDYIRGVA